MKSGDYMLCAFEGGASQNPDTFPSQIEMMDDVSQVASITLLDGGLALNVKYTANPVEAWDATGPQGEPYRLVTHDVFELEPSTPATGDVALVGFTDGSRYLCYVQAAGNQVDLQLYHIPYLHLTLNMDTLTASDLPGHPPGEVIASLQRCVLNKVVPSERPFAPFSGGWCSLATRRDAHPSRIGGAITPFAIVLHTTDMVPGSFNGLIHRWQTEAGKKNGAHFVIGRDETQGTVQLASIYNNIGHAGDNTGGTTHGNFVSGTNTWHPNNVSVGIEIHCAGGVRQHEGEWRLFESPGHGMPAVPKYEALAESDVIPDPARPGRGWHTVTDYQYRQLEALLAGLDATLADLPQGCVAQSRTQQPQPWGVFNDGRVVGHVSLDAGNKSDPWPQVCEWARNWRAQYTR